MTCAQRRPCYVANYVVFDFLTNLLNTRMKPMALLAVVLLVLAGCENSASLGVLRPAEPAPVIHQLSVDALAVGESLTLSGENFPPFDEGVVEVHFLGEFQPADGTVPSPVDLVVALPAIESSHVTWEQFGRYRVPFAPQGDKIGVFEGIVFAENHFWANAAGDGERRIRQFVEPLQVRLEVLPSLVVLDNRAFGDTFVADCKDPADVVLETLHYGLRVKTLGFTAESVDFSLRPGLLQGDSGGWAVTEENLEQRVLTGGEDELAIVHRWAPVPRYHVGYGTGIEVSVQGPAGALSVDFPMVVVPSAGPNFWRPRETAELFEPQPMSGCIPGGPSSVQVTYSETSSETRSRTQSETFVSSINEQSQALHTSSFCCNDERSFASPRSQSVQLTNLAGSGDMQPEPTDLFAQRGSRRGIVDMAWRRAEGAEPVSDFLISIEGAASMGSDPIPGLWREARDTNPWTLREAFGAVQRTAEIPNALTSEPSDVLFPYFRSWGQTRSYEGQLSAAEISRLPEAESFVSVQARSADIEDALPTSDEELVVASSANSIDIPLDGFVWAGLQGMWFRQATRMLRRGDYVVRDLCGNGTVVGESQLNDWAWAADLAIGESCPPEPNFLPAECRAPPCP